tara:strand:+ start:1458 stop:1793 length:336 start_codon:yes stop_codon:yes gene_type:complete
MHRNRHLLIDTVEIQRITPSSVDARGNISNEWSTSTAAAKCRKISNGSTEDRDGKNTIIEGITIYFGDDVDIKASDRIKDGSKYYEVTAVVTQRDSIGRNCYTTASVIYRE